MRKHRRVTRVAIVLAIAAICVGTGAATTAKAAPPPTPPQCGMIGSWTGYVGGSAAFFGEMTPGTDDKSGQMRLAWLYVASYVLNGAARLSDGQGVWQQIRKGQYSYTWFAYGLDAIGNPIYTVRTTGQVQMTSCNEAQISYTYEAFVPAAFPPQDVTGTPVYSKTDTDAGQIRIPLIVTPE